MLEELFPAKAVGSLKQDVILGFLSFE